jgi:hypothetical protein
MPYKGGQGVFMNDSMLPIISQILFNYGETVFTNMTRTNAMLLDLAPGMTRERVLTRNFVEIGGFNALRKAEAEYPLVRLQLIQSLTDTFCLNKEAAAWVVRLFATALGYESELTLSPLSLIPEKSAAEPQYASLVAIGKAHVAAAAADGTVYAHGENGYFQCDVNQWRNVVAVAAGDDHTLGLKPDGKVLAAGSNTHDQCDVGYLTDIKTLYAYGNDSICVHTNGTVTATGYTKYDLSDFINIKNVVKYPEGLLGIQENGRVVVSGEPDGETGWLLDQENIGQIITTYTHGIIVLKQDGRIYKNNEPDNYFAPWRDIVSMAGLYDGFAVLRKDGTVRVLPYRREQPRIPGAFDSWTDIIALYGKHKRLIGLTRDGYLKAACTDLEWQKRNGSLDFISKWYLGGY